MAEPKLYLIESTAHFELDEDQDAAYRDEPTLAASSPVPVMVEDRDYYNTKPCGNLVPVALLLMPYALVRHGLAQLAERRAAGPAGEGGRGVPRRGADGRLAHPGRRHRPGRPDRRGLPGLEAIADMVGAQLVGTSTWRVLHDLDQLDGYDGALLVATMPATNLRTRDEDT